MNLILLITEESHDEQQQRGGSGGGYYTTRKRLHAQQRWVVLDSLLVVGKTSKPLSFVISRRSNFNNGGLVAIPPVKTSCPDFRVTQ